MLKPSRLSWMILTIVLAMVSLAYAQNASTGAISGAITDPSGAVVPDAQVTVTNQATGETRTVSTTGGGHYEVPLLAPGNYRVEISRSGFKTESTSNVRVVVTETAAVNMRLQVGTASESVTVQGAETQLQTESAELGNVTSGQEIENLPLVTRNYTQILALSPAVSAEVNNASSLGRGSSSQGLGASGFSSQGGITNDNNFKMNGVEVNDLQGGGDTTAGLPIPNPDTLQEFKVVTGQYDASYGRNAGAQVNVLTKGGTNQIHGSLFEYLRNDALNANDWFRDRTKLKKPILKQNQFGGVLGGPIIKNKLFYFGSYQGTRQRNGIDPNCSSVVQTPALTNDRSAAALGALFAGKTGYLGGPSIKADGSNINPIALKILQQKMPDGSYAIPTPQTVDPTQPFDIQGTSRYSIACPYTEDQYMGNGDFQQTDKMKWSARTFFANSLTTKTLPGPNAGSAALPGFPLTTPNKFDDVSLQNSYVFTPTLLNQVEIGYSRAVGSNTAASPFKFSDFGITVPAFDNADPVIGIGAGFPNAPGFGGYGQNLGFVQNTYNVQDDVAWVRGRQTLRFGGGLTKWQSNEPGLIYPGTIYFLSFADFLLGLSGPQIGSPIGNVYTTVDLPGDKARAYRMTAANGYVQDDIKLTSKFTFNLGFRYERVGDVSEAKGRNTGFDFSLANPNPPASGTLQGYIVPANYTGDMPAGVTKIGNNYGIKGLGQNTWNPRVGFAYQIHRNVVLRGGYGMFHSRNTNNPLLQGVSAPPFSIARVNQLQAAAAASLANPFPYALPTLPAFLPYSPTTFITPFQGPDQNYKPPTFHRYSMDTQMELAKDLVLDMGYVGAHGSDLGRIIFPDAGLLATASNPVRGVTTTTVANLAQREAVPGIAVTGLLLYQSVGESWYNALQTSLNKRFSNGLQFLASYTWARDLTTNPGAISASSGATRVYGNPNDLNSTYGPDPFIRPHRFVVSYLYQLPQPVNLHSFIGKIAGGWAVSGVTVVQAGHRLYPTYSNGNNFSGVPYDRPNLVAGCTPATSGSVQSRINSFFQYSCYTKPTIIGTDNKATAFGTAPIGNLIGPDQVNTDLAIIKKTMVPWPGESADVEFRAEMFNVFNHPEFADPSTTWSGNTASTAGGFGQITGMAVNPRIVQFALKYSF